MTNQPFSDELRQVRQILALKENEDTWDAISGALATLKAVVERESAHLPRDVVVTLRSLSQEINAAAMSERSRLSRIAVDVLTVSASELGRSFDPLLSIFVPTLLTLSSRTNKVFASHARVCLNTIISSTQSPHILPFLVQNVEDRSTSLRFTVAEAALTCLNSVNPPDLRRVDRAKEVEILVKVTATDASADIRRLGRQLFDAYQVLLPERVDHFTASLAPTVRKYLGIRTASNCLSQSLSQPTSRPASAMSSHSASSTNAILYEASQTSNHLGFRAPAGNSGLYGTQNHAVSSRPDPSADHLSRGVQRAPERPGTYATSTHTARSVSVRPVAPSSMLPPKVVPNRPPPHSNPHHTDEWESAELACVSPDGPYQRPKTGPLRPELSSTASQAVTDVPLVQDPAQKRAAGPRRILRPELEESNGETSVPIKGPVRPNGSNMTGATSTKDAVLALPAAGPTQFCRTRSSGNVPPETFIASSTHRHHPKPITHPSTIKASHQSEKQTSSTEPDNQAVSRINKPTMSQLARMKANTDAQRRTEARKLDKGQPKKTLKGSAKAATVPKQLHQPVTPQVAEPKPAAEQILEVIEPSEIALPSSPTNGLPQNHTDPQSVAEPIEEIPDTCKNILTPNPSVMIDPATPPATSKLALSAVVQTPISALVDSIRSGFVFTPKPPGEEPAYSDTDEEGNLDNSYLVRDDTFPHTRPLSWERRGSPGSQ
ncbi:hypothetical protein BDW22DRAFT_1358197 [Trametopsis cervina]|nr:hypothetical protein BDW22DRAFT_1358197 [Trametopsis cervina]